MPNTIDIAAIIVYKEDSKYIEKCLDSLTKQTKLPKEIFLAKIQNSSDNKTNQLSVINQEKLGDNTTILTIQNADNFTESLRAVVESQNLSEKYKWVYVVHDDSIISKESLESLNKHAQHSNNLAIIGSKQLTYEDSKLIEVGYSVTKKQQYYSKTLFKETDIGQFDKSGDVFATSLNSAFLNLEFLEKVQWVSSGIGVLGESQNLATKAHLINYRVVIEPKASVRHLQRTYRGSEEENEFHYENSINARYFTMYYSRLLLKPKGSLFLSWLFMITKLPILALYNTLRLQRTFLKARLYSFICMTKSLDSLIKSRRTLFSIRTLNFKQLREFYIPKVTFKDHKEEMDSNILKQYYKEYIPSLEETQKLESLKSKTRTTFVWTLIVGFLFTIILLGSNIISIFTNNAFIGLSLSQTDYNTFDLFKKLFNGFYLTSLGSYNLSIVAFIPLSILGLGSLQIGINLFIVLSPLIQAIASFCFTGTFTRKNSIRFLFTCFLTFNPAFIAFIFEGNIRSLITFPLVLILISSTSKRFGLNKRDFDLLEFKNYRWTFVFALSSLLLVTLNSSLFPLFVLLVIVEIIFCKSKLETILSSIPTLIAFLPIVFSMFVNPSISKFWSLFIYSNKNLNLSTINSLLPVHIFSNTTSLIDYSPFLIILYALLSFIFISILDKIIDKKIGKTLFFVISLKPIYFLVVSAIIFVGINFLGSTSNEYTLKTTSNDIVGALGNRVQNINNEPNILVISRSSNSHYSYKLLNNKNIEYVELTQNSIAQNTFREEDEKDKDIRQFITKILSGSRDDLTKEFQYFRIGGVQIQKYMNNPFYYDDLVSKINSSPLLDKMTENEESSFWQYKYLDKLPKINLGQTNISKIIIQISLFSLFLFIVFMNILNFLPNRRKSEAIRSEV